MASSLCLLAVALCFEITTALTFHVPSEATIGKPIDITWTILSTDPNQATFALEQNNPTDTGGVQVAAIRNVSLALGSLLYTIPPVTPGPHYAILALPTDNAPILLALSSDFTIVAASDETSPAPTTRMPSTNTPPGATTGPNSKLSTQKDSTASDGISPTSSMASSVIPYTASPPGANSQFSDMTDSTTTSGTEGSTALAAGSTSLHSELSHSALAGIVIASLFVPAIILAIFLWLYRRRRRAEPRPAIVEEVEEITPPISEPASTLQKSATSGFGTETRTVVSQPESESIPSEVALLRERVQELERRFQISDATASPPPYN